MRFELLFLDTADPLLGRLDYASLSQQALMEMVISEITNKEKICGDVDEPEDIEQWEGVIIEDGEVVDIEWDVCGLEGSLCVEWLPSSVIGFIASENEFTCTLNWASLPTSMTHLDLRNNAFTGPIDLEKLPVRIKYLDVSINQFSGCLKLDSLPDTLTYFYANNNQFSGSVDLTGLPAALMSLHISQNQLSANPTKGHLSVVGWNSTPVFGEAKNLLKPLVVFLSWRRPY
ncbi:leucine-rich repeat protein [Perkinsela sp. CCAP 1560/4]|nr:leucine-rich repeat protein [Perkinsela sp. CCAP 1560/4]|eukprot:KNH06297.1 leucine-rich repeat protein [Perkinsela sp. CCAP 1560/4]